MTKEEFAEELDNIIDAAAGLTEGETKDYTNELAAYDEELAEAVLQAFVALEYAAELAIALKEDA